MINVIYLSIREKQRGGGGGERERDREREKEKERKRRDVQIASPFTTTYASVIDPQTTVMWCTHWSENFIFLRFLNIEFL